MSWCSDLRIVVTAFGRTKFATTVTDFYGRVANSKTGHLILNQALAQKVTNVSSEFFKDNVPGFLKVSALLCCVSAFTNYKNPKKAIKLVLTGTAAFFLAELMNCSIQKKC